MWLTTALRPVLAGGDVRGDGGGVAIWVAIRVDGVEPAFDDLPAGVLNARAQLIDPAPERLVFLRSSRSLTSWRQAGASFRSRRSLLSSKFVRAVPPSSGPDDGGC
jgi:hypothetical protein